MEGFFRGAILICYRCSSPCDLARVNESRGKLRRGHICILLVLQMRNFHFPLLCGKKPGGAQSALSNNI